jgi:hypothetical protein
MGAPSKLSVIRKAAASARTRPSLLLSWLGNGTEIASTEVLTRDLTLTKREIPSSMGCQLKKKLFME